jgi:hypothetical protein
MPMLLSDEVTRLEPEHENAVAHSCRYVVLW